MLAEVLVRQLAAESQSVTAETQDRVSTVFGEEDIAVPEHLRAEAAPVEAPAAEAIAEEIADAEEEDEAETMRVRDAPEAEAE